MCIYKIVEIKSAQSQEAEARALSGYEIITKKKLELHKFKSCD